LFLHQVPCSKRHILASKDGRNNIFFEASLTASIIALFLYTLLTKTLEKLPHIKNARPPLVHSDIPRVLELSVQVFSDDELFRWLYHHQDKNPNDLRRIQLIRLRTRLVQQGGQAYVTKTELGDELYDEKPQAVGFGFFIRNDNDDGRRDGERRAGSIWWKGSSLAGTNGTR
jgi:hypothetical protein